MNTSQVMLVSNVSGAGASTRESYCLGTGNMTQPEGYGPGQHFPPDNQQHHLVMAIQQGPDSNTYIASGHTSAHSSQSYSTSYLQPQRPDSAPATLMSFPQSSGWYPQLQPMHQPPSNPAAIGQFLFVPSPAPSPTTPGGVSMAYLTPSATTLEATAQIGGIPYGHPAPVPSHVTSTTAFEVATASQTQKAKKKKGVTFRVARLLSKLKVKKEKSRNVKDTVEQD